MPIGSYIGRFAPSPSGPLHAGSLVAALASYLDARTHRGQWLIRIEDIDAPRTIPGAAESILHALASLGMRSDAEVVWQSRRHALYAAALDALQAAVYPCGCSRREIADSQIHSGIDGAAVYPGTCRQCMPAGKQVHSWRLRVPEPGNAADCIDFEDRWLGPVRHCLSTEIGDFILKRADGSWAYQLAVVVDDAAQGITHVVRGGDLLNSTARQIYLQRLLGVATPRYLHVPLVSNANGEKLSKQTGAKALDLTQPVQELLKAANFLGLELDADAIHTLEGFWQHAPAAWSRRMAGLAATRSAA
jgi:glutamyl-Q tRNA(Asp) synthetase